MRDPILLDIEAAVRQQLCRPATLDELLTALLIAQLGARSTSPRYSQSRLTADDRITLRLSAGILAERLLGLLWHCQDCPFEGGAFDPSDVCDLSLAPRTEDPDDDPIGGGG